MKLGLGLYRHLLTRENFQFARRAAPWHAGMAYALGDMRAALQMVERE